ncbi:ERI1 exoribonuclease 2 [Bienertia sinuspersici]
MSARKQGSSGSGCSTNSRKIFKPIVKCKFRHDAAMRSVKNGPNVGAKFYDCPLWPYEEEKVKKLEMKKESLEDDVLQLRNENCDLRFKLVTTSNNKKNLQLALIFSWLLFVVVYCLR